MKKIKINIPNIKLFNPMIRKILQDRIMVKWLYKLTLILVFLIIITILVYNYTFFINELNNNKYKEEKQKRINKFNEEIEKYNNKTVENVEIQEKPEDIWYNDTLPFENSNLFQRKYGFLNSDNDTIEGFGLGDITNAFNKIGDGITDNLGGPINKIIDVVNKIKDGVNTVIDFVGNATGWWNDFTHRFSDIGDGLTDFGKALGDTFVVIFESLESEIVDIYYLVRGGGVCIAHHTQNFRSCLVFWVMDLIAEIVYNICILFPLYILYTMTGVDVMPTWNAIRDKLEYIDSFFRKSLGFSFLHYPPSVMRNCYTCGDVNFSALIDQINDDGAKSRKAFRDLKGEYEKAGNEFLSAFT